MGKYLIFSLKQLKSNLNINKSVGRSGLRPPDIQ